MLCGLAAETPDLCCREMSQLRASQRIIDVVLEGHTRDQKNDTSLRQTLDDIA